MWDQLVERRYYKFQDEIQFLAITIAYCSAAEVFWNDMLYINSRFTYLLTIHDSDNFWGRNMNWFYQGLDHITCMTGLC